MDDITLESQPGGSKSWVKAPTKAVGYLSSGCSMLFIPKTPCFERFWQVAEVSEHVRTSSPAQCSKGAVQKCAFLLLYLPLLARGRMMGATPQVSSNKMLASFPRLNHQNVMFDHQDTRKMLRMVELSKYCGYSNVMFTTHKIDGLNPTHLWWWMGDGLWHCYTNIKPLFTTYQAVLDLVRFCQAPWSKNTLPTAYLTAATETEVKRGAAAATATRRRRRQEEQQAGYVHCVHLIMDTSSDFLANGIYTKCIKMCWFTDGWAWSCLVPIFQTDHGIMLLYLFYIVWVCKNV